MSSRLLEYEVWNRVNACVLTGSHVSGARALAMGITLVEMNKPVLATALEPFPVALRTLDALHPATVEYLRSRSSAVALASYDTRLAAAAVPLAAL